MFSTTNSTIAQDRPLELETRAGARLELSYGELPERFYHRQAPTPAPKPRLVFLNHPLAQALGLNPDQLASEAGLALLAGQRKLAKFDPIAMVYAGHQFGGWSPRLGDGRALLLTEIVAPDGARFDLHLKGSGRTPYARGGDGKAPLGAVLREILVSEGVAALGLPTTRALAGLATGALVQREQPLPGGILARVASSHVRVGTFEYFAARGDIEGLELLADHVIARHFPRAAQAEQPILALIEAVVERQAALVAGWLHLGFIHGVLNTDNVLICGETIDYGPCAFMDAYDPGAVFSSIDSFGRYAYHNQARVTHWNLLQLAAALAPLLSPAEREAAKSAVEGFSDHFAAALWAGYQKKLGFSAWREDDPTLLADLLRQMATHQLDYTLVFRRLSELKAPQRFEHQVDAHIDLSPLKDWLRRYEARCQSEARDPNEAAREMARVNPAIIPRNHQVERAIVAARGGDLAPFNELLSAINEPFSLSEATRAYAAPPAPHERVLQTFCGT